MGLLLHRLQPGPDGGHDQAEGQIRHRRRLLLGVVLRQSGDGGGLHQAPGAARDRHGLRPAHRSGALYQGARLQGGHVVGQAGGHQGDGRLLRQRRLAALGLHGKPGRGRRQIRRHIPVSGSHFHGGDLQLLLELPQGRGRAAGDAGAAAAQGRQGQGHARVPVGCAAEREHRHDHELRSRPRPGGARGQLRQPEPDEGARGTPLREVRR
mmetsp:Transcript_70889/g.203099  ORF Transcript_70889/g.203099 Transcript_70889/m.203099 type:complete len:210 (-) Transcript_70889:238-867(-)